MANNGSMPILPRRPESRLLELHPIDEFEQTDKFLAEKYAMYMAKIDRKTETDISNILLSIVDKQEFDFMHYGIINAILIEQKNDHRVHDSTCQCLKYFSHLATLATTRNDQWKMTTYALGLIINELFLKMQRPARRQFLFIFGEMMKLDLDGPIFEFIRNATDVPNLRERYDLFDLLLRMFNSNRAFLQALPPSLPRAAYNQAGALIVNLCLQLIGSIDPGSPFEGLRKLAIDLFVWLFRVRQHDALALGKELVFLLLRSCKVPELRNALEDILFNKTEIPGEELVRRSSVLCPVMFSQTTERRVAFSMRQRVERVEFYYRWIEDNYLQTFRDDNGFMRGQLIRFLLQHQYNPTNQPDPAQQQREYYEGKVQLLTCLLTTTTAVEQVHPPWRNQIATSCCTALQLLRDAQGSTVVSQVLENSRVDRSYRDQLRDLFRVRSNFTVVLVQDFVRASPTTAPKVVASAVPPVPKDPRLIDPRQELLPSPPVPALSEPSSTSTSRDDVTNEAPAARVTHKLSKSENDDIRAASRLIFEADAQLDKETRMIHLAEVTKQLPAEIQPAINKLRETFGGTTTDEQRSAEVQSLIMNILQNDSICSDVDHLELVAQAVHWIFGPIVNPASSMLSDSEDALDECFGAPVYVFFRTVVRNDDPSHRTAIIQLIAALRDHNRAVGYLLLFFLKSEASCRENPDITVYSEVSNYCESSVDEMLAEDMMECGINDIKLFSALLPFVFSKFKEHSYGSARLMNVVCKFASSSDLWTLLSEMTRENLTIFKQNSFTNLALSTAEWLSHEQWAFWQLVHGQGVTIEWCTQLITRVDPETQHEIAYNLLLILKRLEREPNTQLVRSIFARPCDSDDELTINMLKTLVSDEDTCTKICELIRSIVKKQLEDNSILLPPGKQKFSQKSNVKLPLEQVLAHLQHFAHQCLYKDSRNVEDFFIKQPLRDAFNLINKSKERETQKLREKYSDIFTTVDNLFEEGDMPQRSLRHGRKTGGKRERKEEPDETAPRHKKMVTRAVLDSDSDE